MADQSVNINIDDYIKGRMDSSDAAAFEAEMAANPTLANEVQQQSQVAGLLEEAGQQEVKSQIAAISASRSSAPKPESPQEKPVKETPQTPAKQGTVSIIKILFHIDGKSSEVVDLSYSFNQEVDDIGQPSSEVKGGLITVELRSESEPNRFAWAIHSDVHKTGKIEFVNANGKISKTLHFEQAYCISYTESYKAFEGQEAGQVNVKEGATERLVLACARIAMGGEEFVGYVG